MIDLHINYQIGDSKDSSSTRDIIISILEYIRSNPTQAILLVINYSEDIYNLSSNFLEENNMTILNPLLLDLLNESKSLINKTFYILSNSTNNVTDNIIKILQLKKIRFNVVINYLKKIFIVSEVKDLFKDFYLRYNASIINVIEVIVQKLSETKVTNFFYHWKNFLSYHKDKLCNLIYDIIAHLSERKGITEAIRDFIIENNNEVLIDLKQNIENDTYRKELFDLIDFRDPGIEKIFEVIFSDKDLLNFVFKFLSNRDFVHNLTDIIINLDNKTYTDGKIPVFFQNLGEKNVSFIIDIAKTILMNLVKEGDFINFVSNDLGAQIEKYIFKESQILDEINVSCRELLDYTFFKNYSNNETIIENLSKSDNEINSTKINVKSDGKYFRYYYIKKLALDTTKDKNDFLTYENCLSDKTSFNYSKEYNIKPIFLIGIIDDADKKKKLKNSIFYEKYNYLQSLCFPQGNQNGKDICTDKDYGIIIKIFSELVENMTTSTVKTLIFDKESVELRRKDYLYFTISVIIMIFPFLIKLILIFSKIIIEKNHKKSEIINKLICDDDSSISINNKKNHENKIIREKKVNDSFIFPKWYRILNEYFDIIKNGEELFKFSNNESNFHNFN